MVHRDYAVPAPIQIRVHDDRLPIYNPGSLPEGWQPYNPDIANAFFWAGEIETWGRGIRPRSACLQKGRDTGAGDSIGAGRPLVRVPVFG